jgi:hypothetical protein
VSWAVPFLRVDDPGKMPTLSLMKDLFPQLEAAGLMDKAANDAFFQAIKDGKPAPNTDKFIVVIGFVSSEQGFLKQH